MSDVGLLRDSQAAHTQPTCHGHAHGSNQSAKHIPGSGHVTQTAKNTGGGDSLNGFFTALGAAWRTPAAALMRSTTLQLPSVHLLVKQRQRTRFHRRNGARRSPTRCCVCGSATTTEQPARLPRPLLPLTTRWCRPGSPALGSPGRPTTRAAACRRLPSPRPRPRPRKKRKPCTGMPKKNSINGPKPTIPPSGLARQPRRVHTNSTVPTTPAATNRVPAAAMPF